MKKTLSRVLALGLALVGVVRGAPVQMPLPVIATDFPASPGPAALPRRDAPPDPLVRPDGTRVATAAEWPARRAEMRALLENYATGHLPPAPGNVTGRELESRVLADGAVRYRLVRLSFGPEGKLGFDLALFTPANAAGPCPTVVWPSFDPTPGAEPLATQPRRPEQGKGLDALTLPLGIPDAPAEVKPRPSATPEEFAAKHAATLRRGYAIAVYHYQDTGEDTIARNADGSWAYRNTRFFPAYPRHDWGLLAAWAWGMSRCVDFLVQQPEFDRTRLIATGHSRLGKAALVAGAFDERFAISAPIGSAGGGVGIYRACGFGRGGGEGLDDMMRKYPNWFGPALHAFAGEAEKLPFDQHWFVALTAPRAFFTADGVSDRICTPDAVRRALRGALPTYALFGGGEPPVALYYGAHGHAFAADDWTALLDFADQRFFGKSGGTKFESLAVPASPLVLDVRALGAAADGKTKDTAVFRRALEQLNAAGGGVLRVPAGEYLIGAIELHSRTTLQLESGAKLVGSPDLADYPIARIRWEGQWEDGHTALISAWDADRIAIVGPGHIAGAEALGRQRNPRAPALIEPVHCADVRFENFSTSYANMWSVHPTRCRDVVARGLTIRSHGGNGDGIDVDSCRNVVIDRCDIDTGDDAIALKSGRGRDGALTGEPTENVTITDCTLGDANYACLGVGSEMTGGVRNVTVARCTFTHAKTNAIYLKSRPGRGGVIENFTATDLTVRDCEGAFLRINLTKSGKEGPDPIPGDEGIPRLRNVRIANVTLANCGGVAEATLTSAATPVDGLVLTGLRGTARTGLDLANVVRAELHGIDVTVAEGPRIKAENCAGIGLPDSGAGSPATVP